MRRRKSGLKRAFSFKNTFADRMVAIWRRTWKKRCRRDQAQWFPYAVYQRNMMGRVIVMIERGISARRVGHEECYHVQFSLFHSRDRHLCPVNASMCHKSMRSQETSYATVPLPNIIFQLHYRLKLYAFKISATILFVADMLHPVRRFTVFRFSDGDMDHRAFWRCTMPILLLWFKPDDITRAYIFDRSTLTLNPAESFNDEESLAERVCVCQAVRAPGSKVTVAQASAPLPVKGASTRTVPVNHSADPLTEGLKPGRRISIHSLL